MAERQTPLRLHRLRAGGAVPRIARTGARSRQEYDWFGSTFILTFSWIAAASLFFFVPYELLRKDPLIDLRLLVSRQFGTCFIIMLLMGGVLISTTQLLPQLLQDQYGYDATLAGLVLSPGGLVTMCVFALIGRFGLFRPKYAMALEG